MSILRASDASPRFEPIVGPTYVAIIAARAEIGASDRASMFGLLDQYFDHVSPARFATDLDEKEWVILLKDRSTGALHGFTTLMRFTCVSEPGTVALFSGDTIVGREAWNEMLLARAWADLTFGLAEREPENAFYWFLICSGFRTYRFLPVFFREFFPRFDRATPPRERELTRRLATAKFGPHFDEAAGVVRPEWPTPLRDGGGVPARPDPHVSFFFQANPGHVSGDELACLARLSSQNLTPAARRMARLR